MFFAPTCRRCRRALSSLSKSAPLTHHSYSHATSLHTRARLQRIALREISEHQRSVDETLAALRAGAQLRFTSAMEEPSSVISTEFEAVVQEMERKRSANSERVGALREQLAAVTAQLAAVNAAAAEGRRRAASSAAAAHRAYPRNHEAESALAFLRREVRRLWYPLTTEDRIRFLSRCLRHAPYGTKLAHALQDKAVDLRRQAAAAATRQAAQAQAAQAQAQAQARGGGMGAMGARAPPAVQPFSGASAAGPGSSAAATRERMAQARVLLAGGLQAAAQPGAGANRGAAWSR